jgi:hypothetical protein
LNGTADERSPGAGDRGAADQEMKHTVATTQNRDDLCPDQGRCGLVLGMPVKYDVGVGRSRMRRPTLVVEPVWNG